MKQWEQWKGSTCVVVASGPSLSQDKPEARQQILEVQSAHAMGWIKVITVNDAYKLLPFADIHYAGDRRWWVEHIENMRKVCKGEMWTKDPGAHEAYGINRVKNHKLNGLCRKPGYVNHGGNSGYQAIGLSYQFGCEKILLIGFDCKYDDSGKRHFFGDHPKGWGNANGLGHWPAAFDTLAKDLKKHGIDCANCTLDTALTGFRLSTLREEL